MEVWSDTSDRDFPVLGSLFGRLAGHRGADEGDEGDDGEGDLTHIFGLLGQHLPGGSGRV